jgi:hypothetical protein
MKFYKTMGAPEVTHNSQIWTRTKTERKIKPTSDRNGGNYVWIDYD